MTSRLTAAWLDFLKSPFWWGLRSTWSVALRNKKSTCEQVYSLARSLCTLTPRVNTITRENLNLVSQYDNCSIPLWFNAAFYFNHNIAFSIVNSYIINGKD